MNESRKLASEILNNGPRAISSSLRCINDGLTMNVEKGMEIEVEEFIEEDMEKDMAEEFNEDCEFI